MKRRFLYSIVGFLCAAGAVMWFWPVIFPVARNQDVTKVENVVLQEADIRTESLPEEKKIAEPEKQVIEGDVAESQAVAEKVPESSLIASVPFAVQAPFGEWDDPLFQNACEEASIVMAEHWLSGKPLTKEIAKQDISALSKFEKKWLGHSVDASVEDTLKLFQDYYGIASGEVHLDIALADIREALASGSIVIVPADGRKLQNPHFTQPGPPRHMLVVIGYDAKMREFIVNDPGTRHGEGYRYDEDVLYGAILDYPTGDHLPIRSVRKSMVTIEKW